MNRDELIQVLEARFIQFPERHQGMSWDAVKAALEKTADIEVLIRMEEADGEIDVVKEEEDGFWFFDCAKESPECRRAVCYDEKALAARKTNKPEAGSAEAKAAAIGAEILNEDDWLYLMSLGEFNVKTQDWIKADEAFRKKGDALFGNTRHSRAFVYYNGVQSYYGVRGFRCKVKISK